MRYIVTGADGKLAGRVAEIMLKNVGGDQLTFTCYKMDRLPADKLKRWQDAGVRVVEADYNNKESLLKEEVKEEEKDEGIIKEVIDFVVKYYLYFMISGGVIVIAGSTAIIILRKKRVL